VTVIKKESVINTVMKSVCVPVPREACAEVLVKFEEEEPFEKCVQQEVERCEVAYNTVRPTVHSYLIPPFAPGLQLLSGDGMLRGEGGPDGDPCGDHLPGALALRLQPGLLLVPRPTGNCSVLQLFCFCHG
jgi:hypothetical protein